MRCQGRPEDGVCPENRNDSTVHNTIADLYLCNSCEEYRWPSLNSANTSNKPSASSSSSTAPKGGGRVTRSERSATKATSATTRMSSSVNSPGVGASGGRKQADTVLSKSSINKKQSVAQNVGTASDKVDVSSNPVSDTAVVVSCNNPPMTPNDGTVHETDDDVATMSIVELTKEVLSLRESVRHLKQKMEFLLSFVGVTDVQDTMSTADCESARTSANTAIPSHATGTALSNSVDQSTQRSGLGGSNDDVTQLSATAVRINGPFRQAVLSAVYIDQETQRRRSRNIVVTGLSESDTCTDSQIVSDRCTNELGISPTFTAVKRLGTILPNKIRPILATLQSEDEAAIIKKSAKKLRLSSDANVRDRVYINPHLTKAERTAAYELRCRRREKGEKGAQLSVPHLNAYALPFHPPDNPSH